MRWRYEIADQRICRAYGVSVRTLHYYDEIGLLKPSFVDEQNGYRFMMKHRWNDAGNFCFTVSWIFSLKSIGEILASPNYDKQKAFAEQKRFTDHQKERLERLIAALNKRKKEESQWVLLTTANETARQQYEDEAKQRWGGTDVYDESQTRTADTPKNNGTMRSAVWMESSLSSQIKKELRRESVDSDTAQRLVKKLQDYITEHFYHCTDEIFSRSRSNVRRRRAIQKQHRQMRRRYCGICFRCYQNLLHEIIPNAIGGSVALSLRIKTCTAENKRKQYFQKRLKYSLNRSKPWQNFLLCVILQTVKDNWISENQFWVSDSHLHNHRCRSASGLSAGLFVL